MTKTATGCKYSVLRRYAALLIEVELATSNQSYHTTIQYVKKLVATIQYVSIGNLNYVKTMIFSIYVISWLYMAN